MPSQRVKEDKRELLKAQVPLELVFKYKGERLSETHLLWGKRVI